MLLALVLACRAPVGLVLPLAPPAENASALPVARLLAPTPLGAGSDVLCPVAQGEHVSPASLDRWIAEGRLAWRVLVVGAKGATYAGRPDARAAAAEQVDAIRALAKRCGTEPAMDALVAVPPEAPYGELVEAFRMAVQVGLEPTWVLVEDPTPGPWPREVARGSGPPEVPVPRPSGSVSDPAALAALLGAGEETVPVHVRVTEGAATVIASDGQPITGPIDEVRAALAASGVACAVVEGRSDVTWHAVVRAVDRLQGAGLETLLAVAVDDAGPDVASALTDRPERTLGLRDEVSVLPIVLPRYCAGEDRGCGCGAVASERDG